MSKEVRTFTGDIAATLPPSQEIDDRAATTVYGAAKWIHAGDTMRSSLSFLLSFLSFCLATSAADYHEQLVLRPLPLSALLASFNFRSNTSLSAFEAHNYRFFPRSLGQILQHAGTRELHLRFSLGRWDAESWGARPWDGAKEGGTGVELWAWLEAETEEEFVLPAICLLACIASSF